MPFSRPKDPETATLMRETQDEVERLKKRVKDLEDTAADYRAMAEWIRGDLYPAIVVAFALIPSPAPSEPP